jgi:uncharacterized protein (UPF0147 family)
VKEEKEFKKEYKSTFFKNRIKDIIYIIDQLLSDSLVSKNTIRVAILLLDNLSKL